MTRLPKPPKEVSRLTNRFSKRGVSANEAMTILNQYVPQSRLRLNQITPEHIKLAQAVMVAMLDCQCKKDFTVKAIRDFLVASGDTKKAIKKIIKINKSLLRSCRPEHIRALADDPKVLKECKNAVVSRFRSPLTILNNHAMSANTNQRGLP